MRIALEEAQAAADRGEAPIGAVIIDPATGEVIARASNSPIANHDPTAHAEILALRAAAEARGDWHLTDTTLVVTLEPCPMCAGAILAARVPVVVFGAWDEKAGAAGSVYDLLRDRRLPHRAEVYGGVEEAACAALLDDFFAQRRTEL